MIEARNEADARETAAAAFVPPVGFRAQRSARPADIDDTADLHV